MTNSSGGLRDAGPTIHLRTYSVRESDGGALCNPAGLTYRWHFTDSPTEVTCKRCLGAIYKIVVSGVGGRSTQEHP